MVAGVANRINGKRFAVIAVVKAVGAPATVHTGDNLRTKVGEITSPHGGCYGRPSLHGWPRIYPMAGLAPQIIAVVLKQLSAFVAGLHAAALTE